MSGHTPGPWTWFITCGADTSRPHIKFLLGSNGQGFGHTAGLYEPTDTANARLIAAAPELLKALQALLQWVEVEIGGVDWRRAHLVAARDAIAKAEGVEVSQ